MAWGPLSFSLAPFVRSRKNLAASFRPFAAWYINLMGYRKYGLKYDDLLLEERPDVQRALNRLTPQEQYDRGYRLKRASLASVHHKPLEKAEWTPANEDTRYLAPHVIDVDKENTERAYWDSVSVSKK